MGRVENGVRHFGHAGAVLVLEESFGTELGTGLRFLVILKLYLKADLQILN